MGWSPYKQICVCGHDIDTHHKNPTTGAAEGCTGHRCDDCKTYRDHLAPKTPVAPPPTLRTPVMPAPLLVGSRVEVIDATSPHYLKEGEVTSLAPNLWGGGQMALVTLEDGFDSQRWFGVADLRVL